LIKDAILLNQMKRSQDVPMLASARYSNYMQIEIEPFPLVA